jgi:hypothetical protein
LNVDVNVCVMAILRRQAGHTLSMRRLHDALIHELGSAAGSYHQLHQRLKQTPATFQLHEQPSPLPGETTWPMEVREQYSGALQDAGLDLSPLVSLAEFGREETPGVLGGLQRTLAAVRAHRDLDPLLAADLLATLSELPQLQEVLERAQRTTTLPHGLPAEP